MSHVEPMSCNTCEGHLAHETIEKKSTGGPKTVEVPTLPSVECVIFFTSQLVVYLSQGFATSSDVESGSF